LHIEVDDLGNTGAGTSTPATVDVPMNVTATQDDPAIDITNVTDTDVAEDNVGGDVLTLDIDLSDVDENLTGLTLDPDWDGQVTLEVKHGTLTLAAGTHSDVRTLTSIDGTTATGTTQDADGNDIGPEPLDGEGGNRDEDHLTDGSGLTTADSGLLVHSAGVNDGTHWRTEAGEAGLVIDLGSDTTIDLLQIWNLNGQGMTDQGANSFQVYISDSPIDPELGINDTNLRRAVKADGTELTTAIDLDPATGLAGYKGQTFLFSGTTAAGIPAEIGDQGDAADDNKNGHEDAYVDYDLTGRYLLLSGLVGDGTYVGLSEIRVYGRDAGSPRLTFEDGDGVDDKKVVFSGSMADLNAALQSLTYTPDADYNSSDPNYAESLTITLDDTNSTGADISGDGDTRTAQMELPLTVTHTQDTPTLDLSATVTDTLDEDDAAGLVLGPIVIGDVDAQPTDENGDPITGDVVYDPAWEAEVTLSVDHGTLTLDDSLLLAHIDPGAGPIGDDVTAAAGFGIHGTNADGSGDPAPVATFDEDSLLTGAGLSLLDFDPDPDVIDERLVHTPGADTSWLIEQQTGGILIKLDAVYTLDVLQIWNFDTLGALDEDQTHFGAQSFDIWVSETGSTAMTQVADDVPLNQATFGDADYQGETYLLSGATTNVIPSELGDEDGTRDVLVDAGGDPIAVEGRWIFLGDLQGFSDGAGTDRVGLSEVRLYGRPQADPDVVFVAGDGQADRTLTMRGSLDDLNAMLADGMVTYHSDPDYNSGVPEDDTLVTDPDHGSFDAAALAADPGITPDMLSVTVDDLGNTGPVPLGVSPVSTEDAEIIVLPIQDKPTVDLSGVTSTNVPEDTDLQLATITLGDPDASYDPAWEGMLTLTADEGLLLPAQSTGMEQIALTETMLTATHADGSHDASNLPAADSNNTLAELVDGGGLSRYGTSWLHTSEQTASEVQQVTFGGIINEVAGSTFTLSFGNLTTDNIEWSATPATLAGNIQTALNTMFGANWTAVAEVAGSGGTDYAVTFQNALENANLPELTADGSRLEGTNPTVSVSTTQEGTGNDVQLLVLSGTDGGTLRLSYEGVEGTTGLTFEAGVSPTAEQVRTQLMTIDAVDEDANENDVTVIGADGGPCTIVFHNDLAGKIVAMLEQGPTVTLDATAMVTELSQGHEEIGWSLAQETGGLLIDLGSIHTIDLMQIWNFNESGLETYGPQSFDLYVSLEDAEPADLSEMTQVLSNQSLTRASGADGYAGETFQFSGAPTGLIPAELGGPTNDLSGTRVRGRYLLLANLSGEAGSSRVGLSELQLYGRLEASSIAYTGTLSELDTLANTTLYRSAPDFNSGDPDNLITGPNPMDPPFTLTLDTITVDLDDQGHTNRDDDPAVGAMQNDPPNTFQITVTPIEDTPEIPTVPGIQMVDEEATLDLDLIEVFDVDSRDQVDPSGAHTYDPDWVGRVTLSVINGSLTLPQAALTAGVTDPVGAKGTDETGTVDTTAINMFRTADNVIDDDGMDQWDHDSDGGAATAALLVHTNQESVAEPTNWSLAQERGGLMIDLGAVYTIDAIQIWNFNLTGNDDDGNPLTEFGPESFDLYVSSTGDTWPTVGSMTPVTAGVALNQAPGTLDYVGETYLFSGTTDTTAAPLDQLGDHADGVTIVKDATTDEQIDLTGRYLFFGNLEGTDSAGGHVGLSQIEVFGRVIGTDNVVLRAGGGLADKTVTFEGPLTDLNTVLKDVTYTSDLDYNSGVPEDDTLETDAAVINAMAPAAKADALAALAADAGITPEVLSITIDDLGNTGPNPLGVSNTASADVQIIVQPTQDEPTVDLSNIGVVDPDTNTVSVPVIVEEDTVLSMPLEIIAFDVDAQPTYNPTDPPSQFDSTLAGWAGYDPNWIGEVTLEAQHGTLTLPQTATVRQIGISVGDATINGTLDDGTTIDAETGDLVEPAPESGEGRYLDEDHLINGNGLSLVDVDNDPATPDVWVHSDELPDPLSATKWSVAENTAGLLIDLGSDWTVDVMQIWNFNVQGLEDYGPDEFDLYVMPEDPTNPNDPPDPTLGINDERVELVKLDIPLNEAGDPNNDGYYVGETYRFGDAGMNLVSEDLDDEIGGATALTETVNGRFLIFSFSHAVDEAALNHLGLSEIQLFGRPVSSPDLTFEDTGIRGQGDGVDDRRITMTGSLYDLNVALDGITYTPDRDYNSGDPRDDMETGATPFDGFALKPDQITITVNDLENTDVDTDPAGGDDIDMESTGTILVTVSPKQDPPTLDDPDHGVTLPGPQTAYEDTPFRLPAIDVFDVDSHATNDGVFAPINGYDPDWQGEVTLSVTEGTLSLRTDFVTEHIFYGSQAHYPVGTSAGIEAKDADGTGSPVAETGAGGVREVSHLFDSSGLSINANGDLIHGSDESSGAQSWSIGQETGGILVDLGDRYTLDLFQLWNLNVAGLESDGATAFDVYVSDEYPTNGIADMTVVVTGQSLPLGGDTDDHDDGYEGETYQFGNPLVPAELSDEDGTIPNLSLVQQNAPTGRYVLFANLNGRSAGLHRVGLSEIRLYGHPATDDPREIVAIKGTQADGSGTVVAESDREAGHLIDNSGLTVDPTLGKLVHTSDESDGEISWSVAQQSGGVLLTLDDVHTIDALQIWNFNTTGPSGEDLTGYGATSFDIWVSDEATFDPADLQLAAEDVPLVRATFDDPDYQGETYLLGSADQNMIPSELGDESGAVTIVTDPTTGRPEMVTGRHILIGGLQGAPGSGHVGLSEIRLYGRPANSPDVGFVVGDGVDDKTMSFRGTLANLNQVLDGNVIYSPDPDYYSPFDGSTVSPLVDADQLVITVDDLGNTDAATPVAAETDQQVIDIVVKPRRVTMDEDGGKVSLESLLSTTMTFSGLGDTVINGTESGNPIVEMAPENGEGGTNDEDHLLDGSGLSLVDLDGESDTPRQLVHSTGANDNTNWRLAQTATGGLLIDLGAEFTIDAMQIWNFNAESLEDSYGAETFDLYISSTAPATLGDMTAVVKDQMDLLPTASAGADGHYAGETYTFGGATVPSELADESGVVTDLGAAPTGRYVFLAVENTDAGATHVGLSEIRFYGHPEVIVLLDETGDPDVQAVFDNNDAWGWDGGISADAARVTLSVEHGRLTLAGTGGLTFPNGSDGVDDATIVAEGSIANLHAALTTIEYEPDPDYNSGGPSGTVTPDKLVIMVDDLNNTNVDWGEDAPRFQTELDITVKPVNDSPVLAVPGFTLEQRTVVEETWLSLPNIQVSDIDEWDGVTVGDPADKSLDVQLKLTLHADYGTIQVRTNVAEGISPFDVAYNNTDTVTVFATVDQINNTLVQADGLRYRGDPNFYSSLNSDINEQLVITVNDGRPDGTTYFGSGPEGTDTEAISLVVTPVNDAPVIDTPGSQTVAEEEDLVITGLSIFEPDFKLVDGTGPLDPSLQIEVTLDVQHGVLTLAGTDVGSGSPPSGLTFTPAGDNGIAASTMTFMGSPDDVNAAFDGMIYRAEDNYEGADTLSIEVHDYGKTGTPGTDRTDTATVNINVEALNDQPEIDVSGVKGTTVAEEADLPLDGIVVTDDDTSTGVVTLTVTLSARHGQLTVLHNVPGGLGSANIQNNGSANVIVTGTPDQITTTFAYHDDDLKKYGVVYRGDKDYYDESTPDTVTITADDNGNIGKRPPLGEPSTNTATIGVTVTPVNDPPVLHAVPGPHSLDEDAPGNYIQLSVDDVDASDPVGGDIKVDLSVTHGSLIVANDVPLGLGAGDIVYNDAPANRSVTLTGKPTEISNTLLSLTGLRYVPANNWTGLDELVLLANDQGNYGAADPVAGSTDDLTIPISVSPINDLPEFVPPLPSGLSVDEGDDASLAVTGISITDVDADDSTPGHVVLTLSVPAGQGSLDVTPDVTDGVPAGRIGGNGTETITLTGSVSEINLTLADDVTYTVPDGDFNSVTNGGDVQLTATINDGGNTGDGPYASGQDVSETISIKVQSTNDDPQFSVPVTQNLEEGDDASLAITGISVSDVDFEEAATPDMTVTLSIPDGQGTLDVAEGVTGGVATVSDNGTHTVKLTGTIAEINATLAAAAGVTYTVPNGDFNELKNLELNNSRPVVLTLTTNDNGNTGIGGGSDVSATLDIMVAPINDNPTIVVPGELVIDEDHRDLTFDAGSATEVSVADVDVAETAAPDDTLVVTLLVYNGTVELEGAPAPAGLTFLSTDNQGNADDGTADSSMQFRGTPTAINAALNGMGFEPTDDFNGRALVQLTVNDQGNTGNDLGGTPDNGADITADIPITITAINDAPAIQAPTSLAAVENQNLNITQIQVQDPDVDETPGGELVVTLDVTDGTLTLADNITDGLVADDFTGSDTSSVTITVQREGGLTAVQRLNNTLSSSGGLVFRGDDGYSGPAVLTITADDQGATGFGGQLITSVDVPITVESLNDPPTVTLPSDQSTDEDTPLTISGISIGDRDAGSGELVATLTVLPVDTVEMGTLSVNSGVGADVGGNGTKTLTLTGTVTEINATLADAAALTFDPLDHVNGVVEISISVNDQGHTGSGGEKTTNATIPVTIHAVNDAPVVQPVVAQATDEDTPLVLSAANGNALSVSDVDADEGTGEVRVRLSAGHGDLTVNTNVSGGVVDPAKILGNGTGSLILTGTPDQINTTLDVGLTYLGDQHFNGADVLVANVNDLFNHGDEVPSVSLFDEEQVTINVVSVNDAPVTAVDDVTTAEDTDLPIPASDLTENDQPGPAAPTGTQDNESDQELSLTDVSATSTQGGTVAWDDVDDTVTYRPPADFNGVDTFTYTVEDNGTPNLSAIGTVTVTVTEVNDSPEPVDDTGTTNEDTPLILTASVLTNNDAAGPATALDETVQTKTLTSTDATSSQGGTVTWSPSSGLVTYTPPEHFNGTDTFAYRVEDDGHTDGASAPKDAAGTVTVTVNAVNDGPQIAGPDAVSVREDTPQPIGGLSVNDLDVHESLPGNLTVTLRVTSGILTVDTSVADGVASAPGNGSNQVTLNGTPSEINATLDDPAGLVYQGTEHFNGQDTLTVTVSDAGQTGSGGPLADEHTVTLTVTAVNDAPVVTPDETQQTVDEDGDLSLTRINVTDVDLAETPNAELTVTLASQDGTFNVDAGVQGGVAQIGNNGTSVVMLTGSLAAINATLTEPTGVTFEPTSDFTGQAFIVATANDQGNTSQPPTPIERAGSATITVTVDPINDVPVANDDPASGDPDITVSEDTVLNYAGRGVLDNDQDVDGDDLNVVDVDGAPGDGTYHVTSTRGVPVEVDVQDGSFVFDPTAVSEFQQLQTGEVLIDTFTYAATDGQATSEPGTVTVTIIGENDAPVTADDSYTVPDNSVFSTLGAGHQTVLANDTDAESDPLRVVGADTESVLGATVVMQENGHFLYDPSSSLTLQALQVGDPDRVDSFTYTVDDNNSGTSIATVTVTVTGANSAPTPVVDQYQTLEYQVLTIGAPGVLANDNEIDSQQLSVVPQTGVATQLGGTVELSVDGSFSYDPTTSQLLRALDADETLNDTFQYTVTDDRGGLATTTVIVTVVGFTDPPYQNPVNDSDVNGDGLVSPIDALIIISYLSANGQGEIPEDTPTVPYLDPSGDGLVTAYDVLLVVQRLNDIAAGLGGGEGESGGSIVVQPTLPEDGARATELVSADATEMNDLTLRAGVTAPDPGSEIATGDSGILATRQSSHPSAIDRTLSANDKKDDRAARPSAFQELATGRWDLEATLDDIAEEIDELNGPRSVDDAIFGRIFG